MKIDLIGYYEVCTGRNRSQRQNDGFIPISHPFSSPLAAIFHGGAQHSDHQMAYKATAKLPPGILIRRLQNADFSAVERQRPHRMAPVHAFDGAQTCLEPGF